MSDPPPIVAGILIGGKSTRMGQPKANLPWGDATLLETVVRTARSVTPECVLLGSADRLPPALASMTRLPDASPAVGPIAGLRSLLAYARDRWCLLLACDMPDMTRSVPAALAGRITPGIGVIAYRVIDRFEPCCALYHPSILPDVERAIAGNHPSLNRLIRSLPHTAVPAEGAIACALRNVNTPADYHPPG